MFVVWMCLCFHSLFSYSMFISWCLIGSSFTCAFFAFLCERACVCVCVQPCSVHVDLGSVTRPNVGHAAGRRCSLWILLLVMLLWRQKAVRATPNRRPPTSPPLSSAERPSPCSPCSPFPGPQSLGCGLWMSATSWLSAQGLAGDWPVVEVQYQALSVSSSFHFLPPASPPISTGCKSVAQTHTSVL